jgi:predicted Zn-ribbon and HTH transcriptional regulator
MPGPVSQSYDGPRDRIPKPPRWAFEHLTDEEYEAILKEPFRCSKCGMMKTHYRLKGYRCPRCD